jgi:2-oxoglutarate ferredoxin oxidoreductase subunit alpha
VTGIARRFIPGQPGGMHTITGLAHDRNSKVAYDPAINEEGLRMRSLKLAALQKTLLPPPVVGGDEGDMLLVGWGSTMGAIEECVSRLRAEGLKVSSLHLRFIQPMPSGIREILARFKHVMTIEGTWSDSPDDELIDEDNRRYSPLALMLRSRFLVDVDCWSEARGQPIKPGTICDVVRSAMQRKGIAS